MTKTYKGGKFLLLFFTCLLFYGNTLWNGYALDDEAVINKNEYVQEGIKGIGNILTTDAYDNYYKQNNSNQQLEGGRYRPLSIVVFAVEHSLFGESPFIRHLINLLLYIFCIFTIYLFLSRFLLNLTDRGEEIAFFSTLLFVAHPIHTEVVANLKSLDEILSLLFMVSTFIFSLLYEQTKKTKDLFLGLLSCLLALFSKEYAITLLFLLPVLFYLKGINNWFKQYLFYVGVILFYIVIRFHFISYPQKSAVEDILNSPYLFATVEQRIATQLFVLGKYVLLLFIPYPLSCDYGYAQIPYHDFTNPAVWISLFVYIIIVGFCIINLIKKRIIAFFLFLFLFNIAMVSNFIIPIGATMGERLIFHSSLGFSALVVYGAIKLKSLMSPIQLRYARIGLVFIFVLFFLETFNRNGQWKNNNTLFITDVHTAPNSVMLNHNAGAQYIDIAEKTKDSMKALTITDTGIVYLRKAVSIYSADITAFLNLGIAYCKKVEPDSAKFYWDIAKRIYSQQPNLPGYYILLAKIFIYKGQEAGKKGNPLEALHDFKNAVVADSLNTDAWFNLAGTWFNLGHNDSAKIAWKKTLQLNPQYPGAADWLKMAENPSPP